MIHVHLHDRHVHLTRFPNIIDILLTLLPKKHSIDQYTMKIRSRSDETYQTDMYLLQPLHLQIIVDLLIILPLKQVKAHTLKIKL